MAVRQNLSPQASEATLGAPSQINHYACDWLHMMTWLTPLARDTKTRRALSLGVLICSQRYNRASYRQIEHTWLRVIRHLREQDFDSRYDAAVLHEHKGKICRMASFRL